MNTLPLYIPITFIVTTIIAIIIFYKAANNLTALMIILVWLTVQSAIALTGFYTHTHTLPPRFMLLPLPPLIFIIILFLTRKGHIFIDTLDVKTLVLLHTVRIAVELVLYWLSEHGVSPKLITFEGRNFDIFSGLTAPLVYYFGFVRPVLGKGVLIAWNIVCLVLLLIVVVHAVLSLPTPFQKFAFDQPNVAMLYFPYVWLPCCLVPLVLLSHLVVLRRLVWIH
jgi:hypothetical protein